MDQRIAGTRCRQIAYSGESSGRRIHGSDVVATCECAASTRCRRVEPERGAERMKIGLTLTTTARARRGASRLTRLQRAVKIVASRAPIG